MYDPRSFIDLMDRCTAEFRASDTKHTIIIEWHGLGGWNGSPDTDPDGFSSGPYIERDANSGNWYMPGDPLGHNNRAFSPHYYNPEPFQMDGEVACSGCCKGTRTRYTPS